MNDLKNNLLEALHAILSKNVLGDKQYESRFKGFIGELSFQDWIRKSRDESLFYSGGYLIPQKPKTRSIINPVYFTVSPDQPNRYIEIYKHLSQLSCESMFFIHWDKNTVFSQWSLDLELSPKSRLRTPSFTTYQFNRELSEFEIVSLDSLLDKFPLKSSRTRSLPIPESTAQTWKAKLLQYEYNDLLDLYVQRLIFDGFIGYSREHGIPSDIDSIVFSTRLNSFLLLEVKEKDLSKRPPQGFGMDVERINDLTLLTNSTNLPTYYVVKHIDNQSDRKLLEWKIIELGKFKNNLAETTIQGGSGMGFENGRYPTQICPYEHFKNLK